MPVKTLILIFQNQSGSSVRMSIDNVKDGITESEVKAAMQEIISRNIFESTGGDFFLISGAQIVTRTVQELAVR